MLLQGTQEIQHIMPPFIKADPFGRYKKKKSIFKTELRAKIVVTRNGQQYVLVMSPLEIDGVPNDVENYVSNLLKLTHPNLIGVSF